jgi:hypothetical protein
MLRTLYPLLIFGLASFLRVPFYLIGPIGCTGAALGNILGMTVFECLLLATGLVCFDTLLPKPDRLNSAVCTFGYDNMRFCWVAGCALGFVVPRHPGPSKSWVLLSSHYLAFRAARPAAFAAGVFGTNCLPALVPSRFLRVVAAYSAADSFLMACFGRYRSPVALGPWVDGFPDRVPHSSLVHLLNDFCRESRPPR